MDSIMALKDHFGIKFMHDNRFLCGLKKKCLYSRCLWILLAVEGDLVQHMQHDGDMEISWIMFCHVKRLHD